MVSDLLFLSMLYSCLSILCLADNNNRCQRDFVEHAREKIKFVKENMPYVHTANKISERKFVLEKFSRLTRGV